MKLIVGKNSTGKTKMLIEQSINSGVPIFAIYESRAKSLKAKSLSYFGKPVAVVTPHDFWQGNYCGDILVDDMEEAFTTLLAEYLRSSDFNVIAATVTEE